MFNTKRSLNVHDISQVFAQIDGNRVKIDLVIISST